MSGVHLKVGGVVVSDSTLNQRKVLFCFRDVGDRRALHAHVKHHSCNDVKVRRST